MDIKYTPTTAIATDKETEITLTDRDFMIYQMLKDIKEMLIVLGRRL